MTTPNYARRTDLSVRHAAKVDTSGGPDACWPWTGATILSPSSGIRYGTILRGGRGSGMVLAHRAAYEIAFGPIPPGMLITHECDFGLCCNPAHLTAADQSKNMRDAYERQRRPMKVTPEQREEIRHLYATGSFTQTDLGRRFGVAQAHISKIIRGKTV